MKKLRPLLLAVTVCCVQQQVSAQTDSTFFDLSRFKAGRQAVQSFNVKGENLARMPFSDISQAVGIWIGPALATQNSIVYVVNGMLVNDINVYSIQDIDSVTVMQPGLGQLTGETRQHQYMVLITTKHNTSNHWQVRMAGASAFINRKDSSAKMGMYHQYNVSASRGTEKLSYGVSAGYLQDMFPQPAPGQWQVNTQPGQNRYRGNIWLEGKFLKRHEFSINAAYATQRQASASSLPVHFYYPDTSTYHTDNLLIKDHVMDISGRLQSRIGWGITNRLMGDYYKYGISGTETVSVKGLETNSSYGKNKMENWVIGDRLGYDLRHRNLYFSAAVDGQYRHLYYTTEQDKYLFDDEYNYMISASGEKLWNTFKTWYITPSVSFGIDGVLDMQVGMLYKKYNGHDTSRRAYPFGSLSFDLLRSLDKNSSVGLRFYASVSQVTDLPELSWMQLSGLNSQTNALNFMEVTEYKATYNPYVLYNYTRYNLAQFGVRLGLLHDRLLVDYTFDKNQIPGLQNVPVPAGSGIEIIPYSTETHYSKHRVAVSLQSDIGELNWISMATTVGVHSRPLIINSFEASDTKDDFITACWANRFVWKQWLAGADVMGIFHKYYIDNDYNKLHYNSVQLQQLYLGRKFSDKHYNYELYAFSRGVTNNSLYPMNDLRMYYGIGGNIWF